MTNKEQYDSDKELICRTARSLAEHFDSVQIFVSRHQPAELDGTMRVSIGTGNWYSRYGQIVEWVNMENERARIHMRRDEEPDEEGGDDED